MSVSVMLVSTRESCDTPSDRSSFSPYTNFTVVARPLGFTTAFSVAREEETDVALAVRTVGLLPEIAKDRSTSVAAANMPYAVRDALTVQVPGATYVTVVPLTVQMEVVVDANETDPVDDAVAETVREPELMATSVRAENVMLCDLNGRTDTTPDAETFEPSPR